MTEFIAAISEVPIIGPWIKFVVLLVPPGAVILILGIEHISFICLVCAVWLYFLEKRFGIRAVFPIFKIPWLWICCAGIIIGLFG